MKKIVMPQKTIERLSQYRRLLRDMTRQGKKSVYSHDLSGQMGGTAAQVRRDLMLVGFAGNPKTGYDIYGLLARIGEFLDNPAGDNVALLGVGNLGRALLSFFPAHYPDLRIACAFDTDPEKTGRVLHGCRCHRLDELDVVIREKNITIAIVAVPVDGAQDVTDKLVRVGIRGILNFTPVPLRVPPGIVVENIDMGTALEKVAFLARHKTGI